MNVKTGHKILIIGLGQIGGSLGYDLTASDKVAEVCGFDLATETTFLAKKSNAVNCVVKSLKAGIRSSEIVILATPIRETAKLLPEICELTGPEKIIIDVATTKSGIYKTLASLKSQPNFFGCHPLAGTEGEGIESAQKGLFKDSDFFIIPPNQPNPKSLNKILQIAEIIGARPVFTDLDLHDENIALTINLPYAIAVSLAGMAMRRLDVDPDIYRSFGGSYHSATRVARSSPILTLDMFMTNSDNISNMIGDFIDELKKVERMIKSGDESKLDEYIKQAKVFSGRVYNE